MPRQRRTGLAGRELGVHGLKHSARLHLTRDVSNPFSRRAIVSMAVGAKGMPMPVQLPVRKTEG